MIEDARLAKVLVVGPQGCGKSQALNTLIGKKNQPTKTVGIEFYTKYHTTQKNEKLILQIWDCSGNVAYKSLIKPHFKRADAIIIFSNPSNAKESDLENWIELIKSNESDIQPKIFLVNNIRTDQFDNNNLIENFVQKYKLETFTIDAKNKQSVDSVFNSIANRLQNNYIPPEPLENTPPLLKALVVITIAICTTIIWSKLKK